MLLNNQLIKKLSDFCENQGFWGCQGQGGWGVIMLFHMKELVLKLANYMKLKLKLSILYFLRQ